MRLILFTILAHFICVGNVFVYEMGTFCEDTPSTISKYLRCVYSILPQKQIDSNGEGFRTKGLLPATAFMVNNNFLVTAKHTAAQSPYAIARNIDVCGNFISKYYCERVNSHWQDNDKVHIFNYSETGQLIDTIDIEFDVGFYKIIENQPTHFLQVGNNAKVGQDVLLIGILFDKNSDSYSAKYSIGKIEIIKHSTGTAYLYLISAESQKGWSGGPVIDLASGKVLAVISGEYIFSPHRYIIAWSISGIEKLELKDYNK